MRSFDHPEVADISLDEVMPALADPMRRRIIRQLAAGEAPQACSAFNLPITKSTQTHHFRVLREAGLIQQKYSGTSILNELRRDDLDARMPGLLDAVLDAPEGTAP